MSIERLLDSLRSGVTRVTGVRAAAVEAASCNPAASEQVARVSSLVRESQGATPRNPIDRSGVTAVPAPAQSCTRVTPVTLSEIRDEIAAEEPGSGCWTIHYLGRDPVRVWFFPPVSADEAQRLYRDAEAVEPWVASNSDAVTPLGADEERVIRAWLGLINETDPVVIAEFVAQCQRDLIAREFILALAVSQLPVPAPLPDDRRSCEQCANLIGFRCEAATRGELETSRNYEPILGQLHRCAGYVPWVEVPDTQLIRVPQTEPVTEGDA